MHFGVSDRRPVTVEVNYPQGGKRVVQRQSNVRIADYAGRALVVRQASPRR